MDHAATSTGGNVDSQCTRDYASDFRPTRKFKSKDELTTWACDVGRSKGFVIVTLRSDSGAGKKRPSVTLSCERSGKWDKRSSHKETKKCGCPFRLKGKKVAADDEWELTVDNGEHNHEAGQAKEGHSFAGKLSQEDKSLLKGMSKRGAKPKEILMELQRRDEHTKSTYRTIYNGRQHLKLEDYNLMLQQVMRNASEYNYIEKRRLNPRMDTVFEFFLTHPTSLELLSAFPRVLRIKHWPGRCRMRLLTICGITSTNIDFWVATAVLSSKHNSDWALSTLRGAMDDKGVAMPDVIILTETKEAPLKNLTKAIDDVFSPAKLLFCNKFLILCEINEHVENYWLGCDIFRGLDLLVESPTEAEYDEQLKRLHTKLSMCPEALAYVTNTWLKPYKEMLVAAWTDNIMRFGAVDIFFWWTPRPISALGYDDSVGKRDKFWKDMDASLENVHKRIKDSFVESLTNKDEEYENQDYRELRGFVSITALRKIREQTMLADKKDTYHSVCNCAIKRTHGLPCAHEIAKYRTEGRPIPLECIHPHWKKLDLKPLTRTAESGVDKMIKMNNSTPSAPLLSQIVESRQRNSPNAGLSIVHSNQERQPEAEDKVYHHQSTKPLEFIDVCPLVLRPYILDVKDVARDGHCGFRAIASLCNSDEDGWVEVRKNLINELTSNEAHYVQLFGSVQRVNHLHHALFNFGSSCHREHWMTMPDMGHIIASCYNVILIHLSSAQCFTFFPLRTVPISASSPIEIAIGLVEEHFVQVFLKSGHPMPPIPPDLTQKRKNIPPVATYWETTLEQRCTEWASPYIARIDNFKSLQPEELPEHQRSDAVSSMVYEANARVRDPVYGCVGAISSLQQQIEVPQTQLALAQAEVVHLKMGQFPSTSSPAATPETTSPISSLQQQIDVLQTQLAIAQAEVVHLKMGQFPSTSSPAATPETTSPISVKHSMPNNNNNNNSQQQLQHHHHYHPHHQPPSPFLQWTWW